MTPRQRLLTALGGGVPDRLPATTHHVMPSYLKSALGGITKQEFFERFGLDAIEWCVPHRPDEGRGAYADPLQGEPGFLESRRVSSDEWRVYGEDVSRDGRALTRFRVVTPGGELSTVLEDAGYTTWVVEPLIRAKKDIELIG